MIYTVKSFRENLRAAFEEAKISPVQIDRYGEVYELVFKQAKSPEAKKRLVERVIKNSERFCKNGHPIPEGRDRCLGKGCRYS